MHLTGNKPPASDSRRWASEMGCDRLTEDSHNLRLRGLGRFITRRMREWDVPGCAVGIISGDEIIHADVHGLPNVERKEPVKAGTLFYTASSGKTFTARLAAAQHGPLSSRNPPSQV